MKSKKSYLEQQLDKRLSKLEGEKVSKVVNYFRDNTEWKRLADYANVVSIQRMQFNDHGPVHMKIVALNAMKILDLLNAAKVETNLQKEHYGSFEDSRVILLISALVHDLGMAVSREDHELHSLILGKKFIEEPLNIVYDDPLTRVVYQAMITECVSGHMGTKHITSVEAGVLLASDGADMKSGRARIPSILSTKHGLGDIHRYSALAIEKVEIIPGIEKPVRLVVHLSNLAGVFQIETTLLGKLNASPIKPYVELVALHDTKEMKYL